MCYLYPQVYNDGCEVKVTPKKTSCVPCAEHANTFQITRQPCHMGRVVITTFGRCPAHEQPQPSPPKQRHELAGANMERPQKQATFVGSIHSTHHQYNNDAPIQAQAQDGGPNGSWFEIDVDEEQEDDRDSDASSKHSRGSSSSLWGGWMAKVWGGVSSPTVGSRKST